MVYCIESFFLSWNVYPFFVQEWLIRRKKKVTFTLSLFRSFQHFTTWVCSPSQLKLYHSLKVIFPNGCHGISVGWLIFAKQDSKWFCFTSSPVTNWIIYLLCDEQSSKVRHGSAAESAEHKLWNVIYIYVMIIALQFAKPNFCKMLL
jgi:hypothetical protein